MEREVWRELIGIGLVAEDMNIDTIARCAGVSRLEVVEAFVAAEQFGAIVDGEIVPGEATRLVADLPIDQVSKVHAEMTRHFVSLGRNGLVGVERHAPEVTSAADTEMVIGLCDHSGELHLSLGEYETARRLLDVAAKLDLGGDSPHEMKRLLLLAAAIDGQGDVLGARKLLQRASTLGERHGDVDVVVEAAVRHALPSDWYDGDRQALALLERAQRFELTIDQAVRIAAARGMVEMRIPVRPHDGQQLAWITRPEVAQPLTEWAVAESQDLAPETRAMALLAWRSTHRSPRYLTARLAASRELETLSQSLRRPALHVDAAVFLAADALEAGDRKLYDKALGVARWVTNHDGGARLSWRTDTLAAGAAHLEGDVETADQLARQAEVTGEVIAAPGWFAAKMFFETQSIISNDDLAGMKTLLLDEDVPGMNNPLALAGIGYCFASVDDAETAYRYARKALQQLDFEASPLLLMSRLSAVALRLEDVELRHELIDLMAPWSDHVAVDSNAWWCDGPISLWIALLAESIGETDRASALLDAARGPISELHDVRSERRLRWLSRRLGTSETSGAPESLTDRELRVLTMLSEGATNAEIAEALNFSVSTVRDATVSIYRKLGVGGRTEAVAQASALGLLDGSVSAGVLGSG
jgi:DNA-binding CsgD family transcriptional regulator